MKEPETNEEFIYSLIIDDLDEAISKEHRSLLQEWRTLNDTNEQIYQDFVQVHRNIDALYEQQPYTAEASWKVLDKKIDALAYSQPTQKTNNHFGYWLSIAAAILFTLSIGYYFISNDQYIEVSNEQNAGIKSIFLPDGTQVNLNAGTRIKYAKTGFIKHRALQLINGEVFIKVVHQETSPFQVDMGPVHALDIGTSFNLIRNNEDVTLIVEEGIVALKKAQGHSSVVLTKGNTGHYSAQTGKITTARNTDVNFKSWIDKDFIFTETPIKTVAQQLGKVYNASIDIQGNHLKKRKLTAHLHYQTIDSALHVIAETLQCRLSGSSGKYILSEN